MWERTITIGSAGKTFSVTGWKTGWAYGPVNLLFNLQMVHQNSLYTCATPIQVISVENFYHWFATYSILWCKQEAIAISFEAELKRLDAKECYFYSLPVELKSKRDYMIKFLKDIGMQVVVPQGGYFLMADWSPLGQFQKRFRLELILWTLTMIAIFSLITESKVDLESEKDAQKDYRFTKWMIKHVGLQGIPPSVFYNQEHRSLIENYVRYCFFKKDENLVKAEQILKNWVSKWMHENLNLFLVHCWVCQDSSSSIYLPLSNGTHSMLIWIQKCK